nr:MULTISPECIES: conjugal transfer protein TraG N-terminal domain-containing protein [unclassified Streptomyces]
MVLALGVGLNALLRHDEHPAMWLVQALVYAVVVMVAMALQRRRTSRATGASPDAIAGLDRKIRHHEVPNDPEERAVMRRLVDEHLGKIERGKRWLPFWMAFMGMIVVAMFVLAATTGGSLLFPLAFGVFMAAFCAWILWMRRRSLAMNRGMRTALRERG